MARKQKIFLLRFKRIKSLPSISGREIITASSKEVARRKFKRVSVFGKQKITKVIEIK